MKSVVKNEKKSKSIYSWGLNFRAVKIFIVFFLFAVTIAAVAEYSSVRGNFYKESQSVIYSYEDGIYTVSYPDYWEEKYGEDESRPVDISYILDVSQKGPCLFISVLATVFIGIVLVQRESFGNNWHWTLRRIPKYRLIYLFSKLSLVLIPGGIYWLIYMAEAFLKYKYYMSLVPEYALSSTEVKLSHFYNYCGPLSLGAAMVIMSLAVLICNLALRNIRRNLIDFLFSVLGFVLAMMIVMRSVDSVLVSWMIAILWFVVYAVHLFKRI